MEKKLKIFCIFLQTKIFTILTLEKTKRNNKKKQQ